MGLLSTIVSFGAGYTLGAKTGTAPMRRLQSGVARWGGRSGTSRVLPRDVQVRDVMTAAPETVTLDTPLTAAARLMAEKDIGDVIVIEPGTERVAGIVTDRDIAIRGVAKGRNPDTTTVEEIFSRDLVAADPADSVRHVIGLMEDLEVRRLPVVEADRAVGIVSIGDLAVETNVGSAIAEISAAAPDR
jgi:CBS domain-containing protein